MRTHWVVPVNMTQLLICIYLRYPTGRIDIITTMHWTGDKVIILFLALRNVSLVRLMVA